MGFSLIPALAALGGGSAVAGGAIALGAVGATVSAYSAIQTGRNARKEAEATAQQYEEQAGESKIQAQYAANNAARAEEDASANHSQLLRERDRVLGANRAATAASGLQLAGSADFVQTDTALAAEREATSLHNNALTQAGNYRGESLSALRSSAAYKRSAANARTSGRSARTAGFLKATGTLLGGASSAFSAHRAAVKVG